MTPPALTLACLALAPVLALGIAAAAPKAARRDGGGARPFDAGGEDAPNVWADEQRDVTRVYAGQVARLERDTAAPGSYTVVMTGSLVRSDARGGGALPVDDATPGRDRFRITLPPKLPLPFAAGDAIRAEMTLVTVGFSATDGHARVTSARGEDLLLVHTAPAGWRLAAGKLIERAGGIETRAVAVTRPASAAAVQISGWMRLAARGGDGDGDVAVYGHARTRAQAPDRTPRARGAAPPPPPPAPNDWADTFLFALVRLPAAAPAPVPPPRAIDFAPTERESPSR